MDWINVCYIGLYAVLVIFSIISIISKKKIFLSFFVLLLIIFSGFRYDAGIDFFNYERFVTASFSLHYIEPFSRLLLVISREYNDSRVFFVLSSLIYVLGIVFGLNRFKSYSSFTIFVFTLFTMSFLTSFGFVRQYVATGVLFYAFSFLYNNKPIKFLILCVFAALFHVSAIIYIIFYFLNFLVKKSYKLYFYIFLIIASLLSTKIVVLLIRQIGFYAHYFDRDNVAAGKKIYWSTLLVTLFVLLTQHFFVKKVNRTPVFLYSQNMVVICLCLYGLFLPFGEHLTRVSYYLVPFYYIWFYHVFKGITQKNVKYLYLVFIVIVCTFYYFSTQYFAHLSPTRDFLNNYIFNF